MENQIYRVRLSDETTLEFYVVSTNATNPLRDIKELGIVVLGKGLQLDGDLDSNQLESLISYLQDCRRYIEKFNENSKPNE